MLEITESPNRIFRPVGSSFSDKDGRVAGRRFFSVVQIPDKIPDDLFRVIVPCAPSGLDKTEFVAFRIKPTYVRVADEPVATRVTF